MTPGQVIFELLTNAEDDRAERNGDTDNMLMAVRFGFNADQGEFDRFRRTLRQ